MKGKRLKQKRKSSILIIPLILYTFLFLYLFAWGLMTSLKNVDDFNAGNVLGLPIQWTIENFKTVYNNMYVRVYLEDGSPYHVYFGEQILYSVVYAVGAAFCSTFVTCITAYATSRFNYKFSKVVYTVVIVCLALPIVGSLPSELELSQKMGTYDHIWGLWFLKSHALNMYYLVFFATFRSMPKEIPEAAYMDGAGEFRIFFKLMLPLAKPLFTTVFLLFFISYWNDYQTPLMFMPSYPTLSLGVFQASMTSATFMSEVPVKISACFLLVIPIAIASIAFRKKLMGNVMVGAVKG